MSNFVPSKTHLREVILHYFLAKESSAETYRMLVEIYGEQASSRKTCYNWFHRFENDDFDIGNPSKKFENPELPELLEEDPCQTLQEFSAALHVDPSTISRRLHLMGMVQKQGTWVPHELKERDIERRKTMCELLLQRESRNTLL
jgi:transposase